MGPPLVDRHLALAGFMGAGKTTVGADVAGRLGRPFVDLDRELERRAGRSIADLFADGEAAFRELEAAVLAEVLGAREPTVVALGGGTVGESKALLAERAFTVLLNADVETAWSRVRGSDRPLARGEDAFRKLYAERAPIYREAAEGVATDAEGVILAAGRVRVEAGSLQKLARLVPGDGAVALVADAHVAGIHGAAAQLSIGARLASTHELPAGEGAKTPAAVERLWSDLSLGRRDTIVALGGGAATDAAGFAAATYMRGLSWVPVPTTLVGQVDAAIGGKTAIDLPHGKNLVGAFHWPVQAVIDPGLLATLPEPERRAGMAEVVKTGLLAGEPLWELPDIELVRRCAAYKTAVCLRDPHELGVRAFLNLGHTFAHALEAAADYDGIRHGEAVALGLLAALRLSGGDTAVVEELLSPRPVRVDRERAWTALGRDKKGGRLVLLPEPGCPVVADVPESDVRLALDALIAD